MDEAKIHEIRHWLVKAKHDVGSARLLMTGEEPYLDTAVYHCQQAAEKALKAYLTLKDTPFNKIHDIAILIGQCAEFDRGFEDLSALADVLTPYATAFRYPGDILEPTAPDAEEAVEMAERIVAFVLQRMPDDMRRLPEKPTTANGQT